MLLIDNMKIKIKTRLLYQYISTSCVSYILNYNKNHVYAVYVSSKTRLFLQKKEDIPSIFIYINYNMVYLFYIYLYNNESLETT